MATKSSFFLAVLLIANPFILLFFQNCTPSLQDRNVAAVENQSPIVNNEFEPVFNVGKNLKIK